MDAIIRFLQDTGFYLFSQDGNWRCLIMLGIACVLLYLGIVKKFEPLLLVGIAFGCLLVNVSNFFVDGASSANACTIRNCGMRSWKKAASITTATDTSWRTADCWISCISA